MKIGFWEIIIVGLLYFIFTKYSKFSKIKDNKKDEIQINEYKKFSHSKSDSEEVIDVTNSTNKGRK